MTDEPSVGINGSVAFSMNGGRTEYNNWELDGGDNMDNGSNGTLNVYPSLDAIAEFKVLTSNYGAQYGRNGSGTVEVETKGGTKDFHGDAYEFVRNDAFNAQNYFNSAAAGGTGVALYKKNDFLATPSADRFTSPASTIRTSKRRSSSGRKNGARSACRVPSTLQCPIAPNALATSATYAQVRAPNFPVRPLLTSLWARPSQTIPTVRQLGLDHTMGKLWTAPRLPPTWASPITR